MEYRLRRATDSDRNFLWELHVATMKDYVAQTWGWDEESQQRRFREHFAPERYQIIIVAGEDVGAVVVE